MTLADSVIFNDTELRAASLRQLSILSTFEIHSTNLRDHYFPTYLYYFLVQLNIFLLCMTVTVTLHDLEAVTLTYDVFSQ